MVTALDCFAVINWLLALLERDEGLLPRGLASFMPAAPGHLAEILRGAHVINFHLKDSLDRVLNLRLGRTSIDTERQQLTSILRLFLGHQRLFGNHRRLDNVPN